MPEPRELSRAEIEGTIRDFRLAARAAISAGATEPLYQAFVVELARLKPAYLHIIQTGDDELLRWIRPRWPTSLVVNRPGRPRETIAMDVDSGLADIASVATQVRPSRWEHLGPACAQFRLALRRLRPSG